jgi:hypothetical protein
LFIETECLIRNLCCTAELGSPAFTRHGQWHQTVFHNDIDRA